MQDFMEKWNSDSRYRTKIKLLLYTSFVIIVAIFAISNRSDIPTDEFQNNLPNDENLLNQPNNQEEKKNDIINNPDKYNYHITVTINDIEYQYSGTNNNDEITINKQVDDLTTNYLYKNNSYYKQENENYLLVPKDEIFQELIDSNYLKLTTINEYLTKSTQEETKFLVYLKDIILENTSQNYITIQKENNQITIDYTNLMQELDKKTIDNQPIENYLVELLIEEIE